MNESSWILVLVRYFCELQCVHRNRRSRELDPLAYFLALAIKIIYLSDGDIQLTRLHQKNQPRCWDLKKKKNPLN